MEGVDFSGNMHMFKSTSHLWFDQRATSYERKARGKQEELFRTLFLRSVSGTFLTFIFANYFSFKYAHPNSHLWTFHTSTSTFPALPEKQTIFPLLLLGNVREQLLGPDPELVLPHVATWISNKRQHSWKKEKRFLETKTQIIRFKADRETTGRIVEATYSKASGTHRFEEVTRLPLFSYLPSF